MGKRESMSSFISEAINNEFDKGSKFRYDARSEGSRCESGPRPTGRQADSFREWHCGASSISRNIGGLIVSNSRVHQPYQLLTNATTAEHCICHAIH